MAAGRSAAPARGGQRNGQSASSPWPHYQAATLGLRNYWYPAAWSRQIGAKPAVRQLLGEPIMLRREGGKVYALHDQCPHRGIPLSVGRQEFAGAWTCRYHGWTYDLASGELRAALTDGPDSPIRGKVCVRTYPVQERAGLVWIWMGDGPPASLEADVPEQFLQEDSVVMGRISIQRGNWRIAVEGSSDFGHAFYLHRYGNFHFLFRKLPAYHQAADFEEQGGWLMKVRASTHQAFQADYPGLGIWPRKRFWKWLRRNQRISIRLPGVVRLEYSTDPYTDYIWVVPVDEDHHQLCQLSVLRARGIRALAFRLHYRLYLYWAHHVQFNGQDAWMISLMRRLPSPVRLYRP